MRSNDKCDKIVRKEMSAEPVSGVEAEETDQIVYNKASENLIEISLSYARLWIVNEKLRDTGIDSIVWKQMFVEWANMFEAERADTDWDQEDYLEEIRKYAQHKILEYADLD